MTIWLLFFLGGGKRTNGLRYFSEVKKEKLKVFGKFLFALAFVFAPSPVSIM